MQLKLWEWRPWNRQGIVAVVISALLMVWIYTSLEERPKRTSSPPGHTPDSYMTDFVRTDMSDQGKIKARLEAMRMDHYADDQSVELTSPTLHYYEDRPQPWRVKADKAWADSEQNVLMMSGAVQVWRDDNAGRLELQVNTSSAMVFPKTREVEGGAAVTIQTAHARHDAVGFRVDFVHRRIELLNHVKSRYEKTGKLP